MKKLIISSLLLSSLLVTNSCRQDFLESSPTETLGTVPVEAKLNGLYLMMAKPGTGGTTGHDDFGQKGFDIFTDMLSGDMVLGATTYGWYSRLANLTAMDDFTNNINYLPWRHYYRIIAAANNIIKDLGGNNAVLTTSTDKANMAQAKALRAYAYFYLVQMYTPKYDPTQPALPLYIENTTAGAPKSTQAEVYALIVDDLVKASADLSGFTRPHKGYLDKDVVNGILAYVYSAMGKNAEAATLASAIAAKYPVSLAKDIVYDPATKSGGGFNDITSPNWMWGIDLIQANDYDLISWWGQVDIFTYSYAWAGDPKAIDLGLYAKIDPTDVRKNQFVSVTETATGYTMDAADQPGDYEAVPANKFFDPARTIGGQRVVLTDYVYMRGDEFHLLAAENYAKAGNESQAKTILKNFVSKRKPSTAYIDALSGNALLAEIYTQTRIEFWGEGKSYLAMKRNKASITRGPNHLFFANQTFNYDDSRLTFDIPQAEINNNPKLK